MSAMRQGFIHRAAQRSASSLPTPPSRHATPADASTLPSTFRLPLLVAQSSASPASQRHLSPEPLHHTPPHYTNSSHLTPQPALQHTAFGHTASPPSTSHTNHNTFPEHPTTAPTAVHLLSSNARPSTHTFNPFAVCGSSSGLSSSRRVTFCPIP